MKCLVRISKISSLAALAALGLISSGCATTPTRDDSLPPPPPSMADKIGQSVKSGVDKTAGFVGIKPKQQTPPDSEIVQVAARSEEPTPDLLVSVAQMHERGGRLADAEKQYERVLKTSPNYLPALLGYAHLNSERGNFDAAVKLYQKAIATHPKEAAPFNDLGICYQKRGMLVESAKALQRAVQLEPQRKLYRDNLASVLVAMGHVDEALVHLTAAHGAAIAHYNIGFLLNQKGDKPGALAHFHQALTKDPSLAAAQEWIARLSAGDARRDIQFAGPVYSAPPTRFVAQAGPLPPRDSALTVVGPQTGPAPTAPPVQWVPQSAPLVMRDEMRVAVRPQPSLAPIGPPMKWADQSAPLIVREETVAVAGPLPSPVPVAPPVGAPPSPVSTAPPVEPPPNPISSAPPVAPPRSPISTAPPVGAPPSSISTPPPANLVAQAPVVQREETVAGVGPSPSPVSTAPAAKPDVRAAAVPPRHDASELLLPPEPAPLPKFLDARASASRDAGGE